RRAEPDERRAARGADALVPAGRPTRAPGPPAARIDPGGGALVRLPDRAAWPPGGRGRRRERRLMRRLRAPRAAAPLRHRGYRLLVAGQVTSNVGDACYAVALPWFVLSGHGGTALLGIVLAAYGIPRTALIMAGGWASDRWRPQTVMLASDAVRVLAAAALAVMAAAGPARAALLVPVAVVLGAGEGMFLPASFSVIPSLLPGEGLRALLRAERVLSVLIVVNIAANLGSAGLDGVALPALAHGPLHASAQGYGAILAGFAAGALLGTLA